MNSDLIKAEAIAAYNQAFDCVESGHNPLLAVELAAASLYLWKKIGSNQNLAIGYWLYSRALGLASESHLAIKAAEESIVLVNEIENAPDWLIASVHEGLARALKIANDESASIIIEKTKVLISEIADPEDRELIQNQFSTLLN